MAIFEINVEECSSFVCFTMHTASLLAIGCKILFSLSLSLVVLRNVTRTAGCKDSEVLPGWCHVAASGESVCRHLLNKG